MELFKVCLPPKTCGINDLYIRTRSGISEFKDGTCILHPDSEVSADTYFNIFSSSKYSKFTRAQEISVTTSVSGKLDVELRSISSSGEVVIETRSVNSDKEETISFLFNITGLDDDAPICHYLLYRSYGVSVIHSLGSYTTNVAAEAVSLGIVICTFNRKERVLKNLNRINRMISDINYGLADKVTVYVVDNGRTLNEADINNGHTKLIPNKNDGGSGGFTRGIMESMADDNTHILLMDDDVEIDSNVVYKTLNLVSLLNDKHREAFILGGMLLPDRPIIQYEAGSEYLSEFKRGKHLLDLTDIRMLLHNDKWEPADYGGWWYMCMPASAVDVLPLPLFIKLDDVEFGIRRMRDHIVMNGIGIWHDSFESKINPVIDYYFLKRNSLILSALYSKDNGLKVGIWYIRNMLHYIKRGKCDEYFYTGKAVEDFMRGPDFIRGASQAELLDITSPWKVSNETNRAEAKAKLLKNTSVRNIISILLKGISVSKKWNRLRRQYKKESEYLSSYEYWMSRR